MTENTFNFSYVLERLDKIIKENFLLQDIYKINKDNNPIDFSTLVCEPGVKND